MDDDPAIVAAPEGALLHVRVQPKASRNAIRAGAGGCYRIAVTAPPVDNAANAAVCAYLAKMLGVPKRAVSLSQGAKSRHKVILVNNLTPEEVRLRLANAE